MSREEAIARSRDRMTREESIEVLNHLADHNVNVALDVFTPYGWTQIHALAQAREVVESIENARKRSACSCSPRGVQ